MNERGYLYLLIGGAMLASPTLLFIPGDVAGFGWIPIFMGIRSMQTSPREVQNALYFAIFGMFISWSLRLGVEIVPEFFIQNQLVPLLSILREFFTVGVFFWLLKAEYMWSPNQQKRIEWMGFSAIGLVYFLMMAVFIFAGQGIPMEIVLFTLRIFRPLSLVYYGVLVFIFAKLYLESRNGSGLRRWK